MKKLSVPFKLCFWLLFLTVAGQAAVLTFLISYSFGISDRFRRSFSDKVYIENIVDYQHISRNIDAWESLLIIQTKFSCCSLDETVEFWRPGNPHVAQLIQTCCADVVNPEDCSHLQLRQNNTHQPFFGVVLERFEEDLYILTPRIMLQFLTSLLNLVMDFRDVTTETVNKVNNRVKELSLTM